VLHATWNAALRSGVDRLWFITVMSFATTVAAVLSYSPAAAFAEELDVSGHLGGLTGRLQHLSGSCLSIRRIGQVYPIVRGSVPLMVSIGGFVLAGQRLSSSALLA